MKSLNDYLAESEQPRVGDNVDIEIGFDDLIETYVIEVLEDDSIVVQSDPTTLRLLENCGCTFETIRRYGAVGSSPGMGYSLEEDQDAEVLAGKELATDITNPMPGVHENEHETGEYDYEGDMAKDDLHTIIRAARKLNGMLDDDENMPEWVQSKINKAADYVDTAADYIESNKEQEVDIDEAEYHGREVPLNKPMAGDVKKSKVYVKDPVTGNIKKVNFGHGGTSAKRAGQETMRIKKSNPDRRKSFRARHNCDNPGPKTKARYWSCRAW
jgi:hypothetical protein